MIKFKIKSKILQGERCKFGKVLKKCKICRAFDIFLDILHKMNENLGREHVKGSFYPPRQNWKIVNDFPGK